VKSESTATAGEFDWNPEVLEEFCNCIVAGDSVRSLAGNGRFPSESAIYRKMARDPEFASTITRAREAFTESDMEYCIELADSASPMDWQVKKLQIWARQWRAGRMYPKKYGDRVTQEHVGKDGGAMKHEMAITPEFAEEVRRISTIKDGMNPPSAYEEKSTPGA
jgi:hypothetical protein